jgi:hypothetical protein
MFNLFERDYNGGLVVERGTSVFVGDAAGRPVRGVSSHFLVHQRVTLCRN